MSAARLVYLAGPEVFLPDAVAIGEAKKAICREQGFDAVFPFDDVPDVAPEEDTGDGRAIFRRCVAHMERCDLVIANVTPFRGPSMDVGTAVELGFMYARGRPVFAYTNVVDDYAQRVEPDGMEIEAFGFFDNIMCEGPVLESGVTVVRTAVAPGERLRDLRGFEVCVRQAAAQEPRVRRCWS